LPCGANVRRVRRDGLKRHARHVCVAIGLIVFAVAFLIVVLVTPFSVKKEIEDDQNISLAVIIGSVIIGIAMIISAAIHG